ncbi:hypothetical protein SDC9_195585 [bioreactor metagenome]|uniref:ArpU family transcriptional regulator n=1 Tax=bioreactor metagenome TaxID=1076179 RepID=A0A645I9H3_9ZZZZ
MTSLSCRPSADEGGYTSGEILDAFRFYARMQKEQRLLPKHADPTGLDEGQRQVLRIVTRTLYRLSRQPQGEAMLKLVELVYFYDASSLRKKGDINMRVTKASLCLHYSERQIYYYLKRVREIFCEVAYELERFG